METYGTFEHGNYTDRTFEHGDYTDDLPQNIRDELANRDLLTIQRRFFWLVLIGISQFLSVINDLIMLWAKIHVDVFNIFAILEIICKLVAIVKCIHTIWIDYHSSNQPHTNNIVRSIDTIINHSQSYFHHNIVMTDNDIVRGFALLANAIDNANLSTRNAIIRLDTRIDNLETKVDNLETKVDNLETKVDTGFKAILDQLSLINQRLPPMTHT